MSEYKYIQKGKQSESWSNLILAADSDYVSALIGGYLDISNFSTLWLTSQSVEKYLKTYLLKNEPNKNVRTFGHNLTDLWKSFIKAENGYEDYEEFVMEIDMNGGSYNLRYGMGIDIKVPIFYQEFAQLGMRLRQSILEENERKERDRLLLTDFAYGGNSNFLMEKPIIDTRALMKLIVIQLGLFK